MTNLTTVATVPSILTKTELATSGADALPSSFSQTYHELGATHVVEADVLEQLKSNLSQLEDLHLRMKFMMGELNYLLRKTSF